MLCKVNDDTRKNSLFSKWKPAARRVQSMSQLLVITIRYVHIACCMRMLITVFRTCRFCQRSTVNVSSDYWWKNIGKLLYK